MVTPAKPSPTMQPPTQPPQESTPAAPEKSRSQRLAEALQKFVTVKPTQNGSYYSHEGVCTKCGWHTLQNDEGEAKKLVWQHVQVHWRDAAMQAGLGG